MKPRFRPHGHLTVEAYLNGEQRQHLNTSNLVFDVKCLVAFMSHIMTMLPGDVISTGTSSDVGPMQPGYIMEVRIEKIGVLYNQVVA